MIERMIWNKNVSKNKKTLLLVGIILYAIAIVSYMCVRVLISQGLIADKDSAKDMARSAIVREWQKYDEELKLDDITFDSVIINEMSLQKKKEYIADHRYVEHSKEGKTYPNIGAYIDATYYDIDSHIWRMYIVSGSYRVSDGKGTEYDGTYQIHIAELQDIYFCAEIPEIPLLKELR